jgi:hypothetical protein
MCQSQTKKTGLPTTRDTGVENIPDSLYRQFLKYSINCCNHMLFHCARSYSSNLTATTHPLAIFLPSFPSSCPSQALRTIYYIFCLFDISILVSTYKWKHPVFVSLCLVYFTLMQCLQFHLCCGKWQILLFMGK